MGAPKFYKWTLPYPGPRFVILIRADKDKQTHFRFNGEINRDAVYKFPLPSPDWEEVTEAEAALII